MLDWIWWLWRPLEDSELIVLFEKQAGDDLSFAACCEAATRRWAHCRHKETEMLSNSATWAQLTLKGRRSKLQIQAGSIDAGLTCRALRGGFLWTLAGTRGYLTFKGYFLIFGPLSVNPRDGYVGNSQQCLSATNNSQCLPALIPGVAAMWLADITLVLTGSSVDIITKVAECIIHTYTAYETDKKLFARTWQDRLFLSFILINWVKDVETAQRQTSAVKWSKIFFCSFVLVLKVWKVEAAGYDLNVSA